MMKQIPLNTLGKNTNNLSVLMETFKKNILMSLNVCLPANVVKYNSDNNTVTIQPSIQIVLTDNSFLDMPQIFNIPVLELGGNDLSIKIPLKEGDTGIVIFCDRDITLFKQEKKNTQPNTLRKHDLSDGIFIPMRFGSSGSNNVIIQSSDGNTKFEVTSSGINVKGNITVDGEIVATDVKTDTNISLKTHTHNKGYNNQPTDVPNPSV